MIKKNIIRLLAVASVCMPLVSCEDVLDVNNEKKLSDLAVWSSADAGDMYVLASYKIFSDDAQLAGCRNKFWDSYSDISKSTSWSQYGHPYNTFILQGLNSGEFGAGAFECWSDQYTRIRRANVCLRDLYEYGSKFGDEYLKTRSAEIRLCRAYSYFMLARVYGGVILRTESSGTTGIDDGTFEEDVVRPRATEAQTYRFILDELNYAAENLPEKLSGTWLRGRATKAFAYGLISRIALYAGLYSEAADAAQKVTDLGTASLDPDFAKLFTPDGATSAEYIFNIRYQQGKLTHQWDMSVRPGGDSNINGTGAYAEHVPTAELCDLYEWNDGTPFSWNDWSANHTDPFTDREPRFQATVLYNGASWEGRTIDATVDGYDGYYKFEKTGSTGGKTCTGYFFRKFLQEGNTKFNVDMSTTPEPVMRYAEILLNQAEALANVDFAANKAKALDCVNKVRARVNLPAKDASSLEDFMKIIREERAKELVGEGFRFWDLRRWRLAEATLNGTMMHGVKITKSGDTFNYEVVDCDAGSNRIYPERYNYFSIPLSERSNNSACTNNPNW